MIGALERVAEVFKAALEALSEAAGDAGYQCHWPRVGCQDDVCSGSMVVIGLRDLTVVLRLEGRASGRLHVLCGARGPEEWEHWSSIDYWDIEHMALELPLDLRGKLGTFERHLVGPRTPDVRLRAQVVQEATRPRLQVTGEWSVWNGEVVLPRIYWRGIQPRALFGADMSLRHHSWLALANGMVLPLEADHPMVAKQVDATVRGVGLSQLEADDSQGRSPLDLLLSDGDRRAIGGRRMGRAVQLASADGQRASLLCLLVRLSGTSYRISPSSGAGMDAITAAVETRGTLA